MYKNILVVTDGSEQSKITTEYAAVSAEKWGARLTILSVASPPLEMNPRINGLTDDYCMDFEKIIMSYHLSVLEQAKKTVQKKHPKLEVVIQVKKGNTVSKILEASMDHDVDLVLIGGQGQGKEKSMLGSVSNQIVNRCTKQVLVVK